MNMRIFHLAERRWAPACLLAVCAAVGAAADTPMRYDFDAGDRLVYERRVRAESLEGDRSTLQYREQIQFWILKSDLDEAYVLAELIREQNGRVVDRRAAMFYLDHLGQRRYPDEIKTRLDGTDPIFELLPSLPPAIESGVKWRGATDHRGRRYRCERKRDAAETIERVEYVVEDETGVSELAGRRTRGAYWFDPYARVITRVESETTDRRRRVQAVTLLHKRFVQPKVWTEQRSAECEKYLTSLRREDSLLAELTEAPSHGEACISEIRRTWSELGIELADSEDSPLRRIVAQRSARAAENEPVYRRRAEMAGRWLRSRAADWSLQTPDGSTLRSETLRDRYMLEYFWSADDEECLYGFDALRAAQKRLPSERIRMLCLNIDVDLARAGRAAAMCGRGLTHVLAGAPVGGGKPDELPIARLLSPEGRVLAVYFGLSPRDVEKIAALIE